MVLRVAGSNPVIHPNFNPKEIWGFSFTFLGLLSRVRLITVRKVLCLPAFQLSFFFRIFTEQINRSFLLNFSSAQQSFFVLVTFGAYVQICHNRLRKNCTSPCAKHTAPGEVGGRMRPGKN